MQWKFELLNRLGVATEIEEPMGWDGTSITVSRDTDLHGRFLDFSTTQFTFIGNAYPLIFNEYQTYGVEGKLILIISEVCNEGDSFTELYRGQLLFTNAVFSLTECEATLNIEIASGVMDLKNRSDQKVNLEALTAFDQVTVLPAYAQLGTKITLPAKAALLNNEAKNNADESLDVIGALVPIQESTGMNFGRENITLGFDNIVSAEIGNFQADLVDVLINDSSNISGGVGNYMNYPDGAGGVTPTVFYPLYNSPLVNYSKDSPNFGELNGSTLIELNVHGRIDVKNCGIYEVSFALVRLRERIGPVPDATDPSFTHDNGTRTEDFWEPIPPLEIYNRVLYANTFIDMETPLTPGDVLPIDFGANIDLELLPGDRVYAIFGIFERKVQAQIDSVNAGGPPAYTFNLFEDSFIKMTNRSLGGDNIASSAKVFMVNEAFSRIAESITNNQIKAYSEYFGRPNAEPYATASNGCGALEVLTNGLFIRRLDEKNIDTPPILSISLEDMLSGLNPIHNIGYGIEDDTERPGFKRLRIEPWYWFYKEDIIFQALYPANIKREIQPAEHISIFKGGYSKWAAQAYTGLDEFLTGREWRTQLTAVKNTLSKVSTFVASGYTIEVSRRLGNDTSVDNTYDNEIFIICVKETGAIYEVEQGQILEPANIFDPTTIYNYRISPARNAMRWLPTIFKSYRNIDNTDSIIFTSGDGNFYASGELDDTGNCKLEAHPISEKQDLSGADFVDSNKAFPLLSPERIIFDYDMSVKDFNAILANSGGLIQFGEDPTEVGWIDTLEYKSDGTATFTLIPKYEL